MEKLIVPVFEKISKAWSFIFIFLLSVLLAMFLNKELVVNSISIIKSFIPSEWYILTEQQMNILYHTLSILYIASWIIEQGITHNSKESLSSFLLECHCIMTLLYVIYVNYNYPDVFNTLVQNIFHLFLNYIWSIVPLIICGIHAVGIIYSIITSFLKKIGIPVDELI